MTAFDCSCLWLEIHCGWQNVNLSYLEKPNKVWNLAKYKSDVKSVQILELVLSLFSLNCLSYLDVNGSQQTQKITHGYLFMKKLINHCYEDVQIYHVALLAVSNTVIKKKINLNKNVGQLLCHKRRHRHCIVCCFGWLIVWPKDWFPWGSDQRSIDLGWYFCISTKGEVWYMTSFWIKSQLTRRWLGFCLLESLEVCQD